MAPKIANANQVTNNLENRATNEIGRFKQIKQLIPISEYYEIQRRKLIIEIINTTTDNPIRGVCADHNLQLIEHSGKRVGRPRHNWWTNAINKYWVHIRKYQCERLRRTEYDATSNEQINIIKQAALQQL